MMPQKRLRREGLNINDKDTKLNFIVLREKCASHCLLKVLKDWKRGFVTTPLIKYNRLWLGCCDRDITLDLISSLINASLIACISAMYVLSLGMSSSLFQEKLEPND